MTSAKVLLPENVLKDSDIWKNISEFEKQFKYPLGDKMFSICHGYHGKYYSFFQHIGNTFATIALMNDNGSILGTISCVLREVNGLNVIYVCDYKVAHSHVDNASKIQLFKRAFTECKKALGMDDVRFYFVNMQPVEKNIMVRLISMFFGYSVQTKPIYINQVMKEEFDNMDCRFSSLSGIKDIIVDGQPLPVYHVSPDGDLRYKDIPYQSTIMFSTDTPASDNCIEATMGMYHCDLPIVGTGLI